MKSKDYFVLKKILEYCGQIDEACSMFENDYGKFVNISVFQNACCMCILQIGELCKIISEELRAAHGEIPWKEWSESGISLHTNIQIWIISRHGIRFRKICRC